MLLGSMAPLSASILPGSLSNGTAQFDASKLAPVRPGLLIRCGSARRHRTSLCSPWPTLEQVGRVGIPCTRVRSSLPSHDPLSSRGGRADSMQPCARAGIPRRQTPALSVAGDRLLVGLIGRTDSRSRGGVRIRSALTRFGRLTALCVTRRVSPVRRTQRCTPSWRTTHRAALVAAARERTPPSTALGYACARRVRLPTLLCVSRRGSACSLVSTCHMPRGPRHVVVVRSESTETSCRPPRRLLRALRAHARWGSAHGQGPPQPLGVKWKVGRLFGLIIVVPMLKWFVLMYRSKFRLDLTKFRSPKARKL